MARRVVAAIVQDSLPERDVPDHQVVGGVWIRGPSERLGADLGYRVERSCDGGGDRVQLNTGDLRAVRGEPDEVARAAAWLEDSAAGETEFGCGVPDDSGQCQVGVVGIDRGAACCIELGGGQEAGKLIAGLGVLGASLIEDFRDCAPSRPAGKYGLFWRSRGAAVVLEGA